LIHQNSKYIDEYKKFLFIKRINLLVISFFFLIALFLYNNFHYTSAANVSLINFDESYQSFQYGRRIGISKEDNSCVKLTLYRSDENGNDQDLIQEKTIDFDDQSEYWNLDSDEFDSRRLSIGTYVIHKCVGSSIEDVSSPMDESEYQTKIEYSKVQFEIVPRTINENTSEFLNSTTYGPYNISPVSLVYNGASQTPTFNIYNPEDEDDVLPTTDDYDLENFRDKNGNFIDPSQVVDAEDYIVKLKFKNNFSGEVEVPFSISPQSVNEENFNISPNKLVYNGKSQTPTFNISNKGKGDGICPTSDNYDLEYYKDGKKIDSLVNAGSYVAKFTFKGNFEGSIDISFSISPRIIGQTSILTNDGSYNGTTYYDIYKISPNSLVYNGKSQKPTFNISNDNGEVNPTSDDYDLRNFKNNDGNSIDSSQVVDAGDYIVSLNFKNNFEGSKPVDIPFSISPCNINDFSCEIKENYDKKSGLTFDINTSNGLVISQNDFVVSYEKNGKSINSISEPGDYTAVLTFKGNYSGEKRINFNVPDSSSQSSDEKASETGSKEESKEETKEESTAESKEEASTEEESLKDYKSQWGRKEVRYGIDHYISDDGLLSVEIDKNDKIWMCENENGSSECWYCLDNTNGIFKIGSRFSIKWISKGDPAYDDQIAKIDESKKKNIDLDHSKIFLVSVTDPNGDEYSSFDKVDFYVQISGNWTKENVKALFLNSSDDEIVEAYFETVTSPNGPIECARLVLTHFSPYLLVYQSSESTYVPEDSSSSENRSSKDEVSNSSPDKSSNPDKSSSAPLGHPINYILLCSLLFSVLIYYFIFRKRINNKK